VVKGDMKIKKIIVIILILLGLLFMFLYKKKVKLETTDIPKEYYWQCEFETLNGIGYFRSVYKPTDESCYKVEGKL
jgi:uncharacterized membrane protein